MANQPLPSRPWLILGSKRPVAPPPPALAAQAQAKPLPLPLPQPQPPAPRPFSQPTFGQPFRPTTQPLPQPQTAAAAAPPFRAGNVSSFPSYPTQKAPPPSEKIKPPSPSPSPSTVILPPQPIEQKPSLPFKTSINGGLLQKDADGPAITKPTIVPNYEKRDQQTKDHKADQRQADGKDNSILIIKIAGDNRGCPASLGNAFVINSNVQAVNNSILNTSCSTHDQTGVHVFFSPRGGDL